MKANNEGHSAYLRNLPQAVIFVFTMVLTVNMSGISTAYGFSNRGGGDGTLQPGPIQKIKIINVTPKSTQTEVLRLGGPIMVPPFRINISSIKIAEGIKKNHLSITTGKITWAKLKAKPGHEFILVSWSYQGMTSAGNFNVLTGPSMVLYSSKSQQIDEDIEATVALDWDQGVPNINLEQKPEIWIPEATAFNVSKSEFNGHNWKILVTTADHGVYLSIGKAVSTINKKAHTMPTS